MTFKHVLNNIYIKQVLMLLKMMESTLNTSLNMQVDYFYLIPIDSYKYIILIFTV